MEHSRLLELLGEMSLEEKINQLFQGDSMFYEERTALPQARLPSRALRKKPSGRPEPSWES